MFRLYFSKYKANNRNYEKMQHFENQKQNVQKEFCHSVKKSYFNK